MSHTTKPLSDRDASQTQQAAFNDVNDTIGVDGFIVGLVGRKIIRTLTNPTTENYEFLEGTNSLYTIEIVYTDSTLATISTVERIA